MASKWLAQLKEIAPAVTRVAVLLHPDAVAHEHYWRALVAAAPLLEPGCQEDATRGVLLWGSSSEVLRELVPTAKSVGFLYSRTNLVSGYDRLLKDLESAADALGLKLQSVEVRRFDGFEGAFATVASARSDALLVSPDAIMFGAREALVALAARHKIPTAYPIREFAAGGGLASYGTNYSRVYEEVGDYLGRVLNGEKPESLPVRQVTKLELVINLKTAKALALTFPPTLLARADEVIE